MRLREAPFPPRRWRILLLPLGPWGPRERLTLTRHGDISLYRGLRGAGSGGGRLLHPEEERLGRPMRVGGLGTRVAGGDGVFWDAAVRSSPGERAPGGTRAGCGKALKITGMQASCMRMHAREVLIGTGEGEKRECGQESHSAAAAHVKGGEARIEQGSTITPGFGRKSGARKGGVERAAAMWSRCL